MPRFGRDKSSTKAQNGSAEDNNAGQGYGESNKNSRRNTDLNGLSKNQVKRASRTRMLWATLTSLLLALTVIFLIVAEVGQTRNKRGFTNIYFISVRGNPTLISLSLWARIRSGTMDPVYRYIAWTMPWVTIAQIESAFLGIANFLEPHIRNSCGVAVDAIRDQTGFPISVDSALAFAKRGGLYEIGSTFPFARSIFRDPSPFGNSVALEAPVVLYQTLGLHDFYTVGLWGYCEGYVGQGITGCSKPQSLYWFNPVSIIQSQLLSGASIQLPSDITRVLDIIRLASQVMFGFFLAGACLSFALLFIKPLMVFSRWSALLIGLLGFINAAMLVIASAIATVLFVIMRKVFDDAQQVNIDAHLGNVMFGMIWTATAFALMSWLIDLCLMCCCASRRDVRKGKKRGSEKAYDTEKVTVVEERDT